MAKYKLMHHTPQEAAAILRLQSSKGRALLANRPIAETVEEVWKNMTCNAVAEIFGPASKQSFFIRSMGLTHWMATTDKAVMEQMRERHRGHPLKAPLSSRHKNTVRKRLLN